MRILSLTTKDEWNKFLAENRGSFLQSWGWGEFQTSLLKKIWRFCLGEENKVLEEDQLIKETFPLNLKNFLYIPYGPCFKEELFVKARRKILNLVFKEAKKIAQKENAVFLKIEPTLPWPKDLGGEKSFKRIQPKKTLILDLKKSGEEIFKNFHPKTRYNIRLAQRKGVKIFTATYNTQHTTHNMQQAASKYIDIFYKLVQRTATRDKFAPYQKGYYKKILENLPSELFLAEYKQKIIAANLLIFFGKKTTYLHGGADYKYRKIMAPHLLQWTQIQESQKRGYERYDFWGIDEKRWPGLTRFKKSFQGEELEYQNGKDFVFQSFWYKIYKLIKGF